MKERLPTDTWVRRGTVVVACSVIASPLVAAVVAWRKGWMPVGDEAAAVAQSWGTLSTKPPLLGLYSTVSGVTDASQTLYHPGPMQLWLIAGPLRLFAPSNGGALIASALLVGASVAVVFLAAWRCGGLRLLVPSIVMVACFIAAIGAQFLRAPYLDAASMFMMLGVVGAGWAVVNRDDWFWPVALACATISVQAEVAFSAPIAAIVFAIAITRTVTCLRDRRAGGGRTTRRRSVSILVTTVVVALACWSGPLYDQFFGTGNLWQLLSAGAKGDAVGPGWAMNRLVDTLAFPPAWTHRGLRIDGEVLANGQAVWHTPASQASGAAIFAAVFVAMLIWCVRRRNRPLATFGLIALAGLAGAFGASSAMPNDPISLIGHNRAWLVAGLAAWSFPVLVLSDWAVRTVRERVPSPVVWATAGSAIAGVATLVLVGSMLAASSPANDQNSSSYGAVAQFSDVGRNYCRKAPEGVRVTQDGYGNTLITVGLVAQLQIEGCTVHVGRDLSSTLSGAWFRPTGNERYTLRVSSSATSSRGFRRVSAYDSSSPPAAYRGFDGVYSGMPLSEPQYLSVRER
ncbi:MAG TPA: hypothetical protein VFN21_02075 [Acidimicrobiales bacterium]|nr:hypothetical protein [Acidimicrobiales bacterium]